MRRTAGWLVGIVLLALVMVGQAQAINRAQAAIAAEGSNIYAVWWDTTPGSESICFRRSNNGGATWTALKRLAFGVVTSPVIAVSAPNVYVAYQTYDGGLTRVFVVKSPDRGTTWGSPVFVSDPSVSCMGVTISAALSRVNVYWTQAYGSILLVGHNGSTDAGQTWAGCDFVPDTDDYRHTPCAAAAGSIDILSWHERSSGGWGFYCHDNSASWTMYMWIVDGTERAGLQTDCSDTVAGLIWTESTIGASTVYFSQMPFSDLANWTDRTPLSRAVYCNSPWLAHSGASAYAVWEGSVPPTILDAVYFARSTDKALTWKPDKILSPSGHSCMGPRLAAAGSNVYVTWWEIVKTAAGPRMNLYLRRSQDRGVTWKPIQKIGSQIFGKA